jgi:hypothetical protein
MQSVPITTTKVVSSNAAHGEVYSIQHYVAAGSWFSSGYSGYRHDINEILLKVALASSSYPNLILNILCHHCLFFLSNVLILFSRCKQGELFDYLTQVVTMSEKRTR